ncbi:MAG: triose-phosphate isomerase [Candidatus Heimdallarchaeota archaeon]|nr:triose-phosphate isomerase [Candidatus Heimdallarchaeota archaeon]
MVNFNVLAQDFDIYGENNRYARTGQISLYHLYKCKINGVLIGHSETNNTIKQVKEKIKEIIKFHHKFGKNHLNQNAILFGETWEEYSNNSIDDIIDLNKRNLSEICKNIDSDFIKDTIFIYEPKWGSKGSGKEDFPPPEPKIISMVISASKKTIIKEFNLTNNDLAFLYGGRSTPSRTAQILKDPNIHGLILGSACNTIEKTVANVNSMLQNSMRDSLLVICNFKAYELQESYEDYIKELSKFGDNLTVYFAPPYTDLCYVAKLVSTKKN